MGSWILHQKGKEHGLVIVEGCAPGADPVGRGGGLGGQDSPPPPFGGPPNFIKREKNAACVHVNTPRFST